MARLTPLAVLLALALGCDRGPEPPPVEEEASESPEAPTPEPANPHAGQAPTHGGHGGTAPSGGMGGRAPVVDQNAPQLAGLRWQAGDPLTWRRPTRPMRNAEYAVGEGDTEAVLTIFHFPGMGGSIEENVERWTGQFRDGDEPVVETKTIGGLEVTTIDVSGTFASSMGMGGGEPLSDTRLLGAIVQAPDGPVFFKLLGPKPTVTEAEDAFAAMVQSFEAVR